MQKNTKKKCYKRPAFWLILTTIIIGGLYWLGYIPYWYDSTKGNIAEWQDEQYFKNIEKQQSELERLYKADTYGGDTPEETWALFIAALEAGDVDLASKYFVIEKQEDVRTELTDFLSSTSKKENLDHMKNSGKNELTDNKVEFVYINTTDTEISIQGTDIVLPQGDYKTSSLLILNKETNKWKILEL